jgi:hypothetical protein
VLLDEALGIARAKLAPNHSRRVHAEAVLQRLRAAGSEAQQR